MPFSSLPQTISPLFGFLKYHGGEYACVHVCTQGPKVDIRLSFSITVCLLWQVAQLNPELTYQLVWLTVCLEAFHFHSECWGDKQQACSPGTYTDSGDLQSGPQVSVASAFSSEVSLQT